MSRPSLTLVTHLWNGELYGFPWVELLCEGLAECDEVIVANPEGDDDYEPLHAWPAPDPRGTRAKLRTWAKREPRLRIIETAPMRGSKSFPDPVNMAIEAAKTEFVLFIQADECMDLGNERFWGLFDVGNLRQLLSEGYAVSFPRWDFTCSSSHITPIFPDEPPVTRLIARASFPSIRCVDDAMHLGPARTYLHVPAPIFHYHGLSSESLWKRKEIAFQKLYHDRGMVVDPRIERVGWEAWDGPMSRARKCPATHPRVMHPWLARAEMQTRDLLVSGPRQPVVENAPILDTEEPLG